jgi:hypothetical protein
MTFLLSPKTVALRFFAVVVLLMICHGTGLYVYFTGGNYDLVGPYFDLDTEGNVPTFYSAIAIMVSAVLLYLHGAESRRRKDGQHRRWYGLASIMFFLSFDEAVLLHENMTDIIGQFINPARLFYMLWVLPYGVATLALLLVYFGFLRSLPKRTTLGFVAAGAIFVGGAIGVELFSGHQAVLHGTLSIQYSLAYTLEEFMEMTGIVVFIYALLAHRAQGDVWTIKIARDPDLIQRRGRPLGEGKEVLKFP